MRPMENRWGRLGKLLLIMVCAALAAACFSACSRDEEVPAETTEEAVQGPTAPADGNPDDVTCKGSYTSEDAADAADTVVAAMGDKKLTNGQLQFYYWMEAAAYAQAENAVAPDFSQSLDTQLCELEGTAVTWQQYFLQRALDTWQRSQALMLQSGDREMETEAAYQPDLEVHEINLAEAPAVEYLYGYYDRYQINRMHLEYLESIPQLLEAMAQERGLADIDALAQRIAGPGADGENLIRAAEQYNEGYMYFTSLAYDLDPAAEAVEEFFAENEAAYAAEGITRDSGNYVDMSHILLVPEDAALAADGTVTAGESGWKKCLLSAQSILRSWKKGKGSETKFAERAYDYSADTASRGNGGLYSGLQEGQLIPELNGWLFDEARQAGDTEIIRTDYGYHIVYFAGSREIWYAEAERDLITQMSAELIAGMVEAYPISIDYSAIRLGAGSVETGITMETLLYPDVAHERYPSVPLYLQQDYPEAYYGKFKLSSHGCGPCSLAMVGTYLTDTEISPVALAERFGSYCHSTGSDIKLIENTPSEMGFYMERQTYKWELVQEALENGQVVVCVQGPGHFTSSGHYMALEKITEDGLVVVRDSNLKNYGKLEGHAIDGFSPETVDQAGKSYWIFQKKYTRNPVCVRCGDSEVSGACRSIITEDYCCEKCAAALQRRNDYIAVCGGLNG